MLSKNKLNKPDENIDNTKTEDIDNTKTEYIDNTMTEDIDTGKTEDFDNTKTEDKDEDIYRGRNMFIQVFQHTRREKYRSGNWKKDRSSGSFGVIAMYQNYAKSGYTVTITMHTQGLRSFAHVLVRWFLLENIRQPHQKINQTPT